MRTRITVAVVVLVLLLGGMCFLSATRSARRAAAAMKCKNNLMQIALSLHNHAAGDGDRFPPATIASDKIPPEQRLSWLVTIDPYMEARMDPEWNPRKNEPWTSEANLKLARTMRLRAFACPADFKALEPEGVSYSSYVGATGIGPDAATLPKEDRRAGFFGYDRRITLRDIKDGTGTTIAAIETSTDNGPWMAGGRPTSRAFEPDGPNAIGPGSQFGGFHRGGVNVCFADGSFGFIRDSIDRKTFAALFTIAGGEEAGPIGE